VPLLLCRWEISKFGFLGKNSLYPTVRNFESNSALWPPKVQPRNSIEWISFIKFPQRPSVTPQIFPINTSCAGKGNENPSGGNLRQRGPNQTALVSSLHNLVLHVLMVILFLRNLMNLLRSLLGFTSENHLFHLRAPSRDTGAQSVLQLPSSRRT